MPSASAGFDKGKLGVSRGRKATGLDGLSAQLAGLPEVRSDMSYWDGTKWVADTPPVPKSASRAKRVAAATLEAALITALTFGLIAGSAFAGKGGGGGGGKPGGGGGHGGGGAAPTGSFALVLVDSTDGVAHWGQHITFDVTSTARYYFVGVSCAQGGDPVYRQDIGFYVGWPWSKNFTLMSGNWTGGGANCDAVLYSQNSDGSNRQTLSTMSFLVAA
jgi:hypothetical protein